MNKLDRYTDKLIEMSLNYGPKLILAVLTLIVGWWAIKCFLKFLDHSMDRGNVDITLQRFLLSFVSVLLKALLIISVASMVGIETTSFIAILGAAGLAVGLALQGSLANFAGGVLILFFKPFKVGDVIEAQGFLGIVREIQIFNTIIVTLENERVVIPNGLLSNGCLKNVFAEETRRVDLTFGISYDDDILHAKSVLRKLIGNDKRILSDPKSEVYVCEHGDSSVNLLVRVWVKSENYWPVYFGLLEVVKLEFDKEKITIPYPQRDVHMFSETRP